MVIAWLFMEWVLDVWSEINVDFVVVLLVGWGGDHRPSNGAVPRGSWLWCQVTEMSLHRDRGRVTWVYLVASKALGGGVGGRGGGL